MSHTLTADAGLGNLNTASVADNTFVSDFLVFTAVTFPVLGRPENTFTEQAVLQWDIKQFFHKDNQTIVEWYFKNKMDDGNVEAFDGISLIEWTPDDKIALLKEFGCNENRYDPYKDGTIPHFRDENAKWF